MLKYPPLAVALEQECRLSLPALVEHVPPTRHRVTARGLPQLLQPIAEAHILGGLQ